VPAVVLGDIEPVRRFWQLDRTMAVDTRYPELVINRWQYEDYDSGVIGYITLEDEVMVVTGISGTRMYVNRSTGDVDSFEQSPLAVDREPLLILGPISPPGLPVGPLRPR
jgi:hypothetical protein